MPTPPPGIPFLATRLAQAQARNAVDIRSARDIEERAFAEGQRLLLNEVSGWVIVAFGDAFNTPPPGKGNG